MEIIHLPSVRKAGINSSSFKSKVRAALRKTAVADHAAVCFLGESSYVVHLTNGEKAYVNKLAHSVIEHGLLDDSPVQETQPHNATENSDEAAFSDIDPSSTFIAVAPKREASLYSENRLVSVLFVRNGLIVESRDGRLSPELATYIAQQAATVYNKTIVRFSGMHVSAVEDLAVAMDLGLRWVDIDVSKYSTQLGFFEEIPVDHLREIYKESSAFKFAKFALVGACCVGAFIGYNTFMSEPSPKEVHTTIDDFKQHRETLSGVHSSEHFYRFVEVLDVYYDKKGWSVQSVKGTTGGRYKAVLSPTVETISTPVTPFLLWVRENTDQALELVDYNRLSIDGQFTPVDYLKRFHPYQTDLALNIAQIKDVVSALGDSGIKFGKVKSHSNFKTLMFTISFRSISLVELANLYEALERVPVVSKDLEVKDLKDGTLAITHTMEFVGI